MQNKLKVRQKNAYGHTLIYPECEQSKLIAKLLKKLTFPKNDLDILKQLGYEFELVTEQFEGIQ